MCYFNHVIGYFIRAGDCSQAHGRYVCCRGHSNMANHADILSSCKPSYSRTISSGVVTHFHTAACIVQLKLGHGCLFHQCLNNSHEADNGGLAAMDEQLLALGMLRCRIVDNTSGHWNACLLVFLPCALLRLLCCCCLSIAESLAVCEHVDVEVVGSRARS